MSNWITTTDRNGRRAYCLATGQVVSRDGVGRMCVTVYYAGHDWKSDPLNYGMTDSVREAKAWAEQDVVNDATDVRPCFACGHQHDADASGACWEVPCVAGCEACA